MEMVRERPPGIAWLRFPLSKRLWMMEAIADANIGLFENDCFGWTRAKYFKKDGVVDPSGVSLGGEDVAAHDAPAESDSP